jgi:hypothetical protein
MILVSQTRMYRPQAHDEESTELPQTAEAVAAALRWRTVAECQLGATSVACSFSPQPAAAAVSVDDYDDAQQQQQQQHSEQLLTCSAAGLIRVWPTAALPLEPPLPPVTTAADAAADEHTSSSAAADSSSRYQQADLSDDATAEEQQQARQGDTPLPTSITPRRRASSVSSARRVSFADEPDTAADDSTGDLHRDVSADADAESEERELRANSTLPVPAAAPVRPQQQQQQQQRRHLKQTWGRKAEEQAALLKRSRAALVQPVASSAALHAGEPGQEVFVQPSELAAPAVHSSRTLQVCVHSLLVLVPTAQVLLRTRTTTPRFLQQRVCVCYVFSVDCNVVHPEICT